MVEFKFDGEPEPVDGKRYFHELAWLCSTGLARFDPILLEFGPLEPVEPDDLGRIETALLHRWSQWPDEASALPDWRARVRTLEADTEKLRRWVEGRL